MEATQLLGTSISQAVMGSNREKVNESIAVTNIGSRADSMGLGQPIYERESNIDPVME